MPERQREALVLRYWGDMSVQECAVAMGVTAGSVNQHLSRARMALRDGDVLVVEKEKA